MLKKYFAAILVIGHLSQGFCGDLFEDNKVRVIKYGDSLSSTDTLGGYAIYPGEGRWTFASASNGSASTGAGDTTALGSVLMLQLEPRALLALQKVTVNLGGGSGSSWSGTPCSTGHLVSRNKGRGKYDNCMTIDPVNVLVDNNSLLFFSVVLTNTASNGRYYKVVLDLNPAFLGMRDTSLGDWAPEVLAIRTHQQTFLKNLSAWAEKLQDASMKAFEYNKPQDTFADLPSFRTLLPIPVELADKKLPLAFFSTVEDLRYKKAFSSIAYAEGKTSRWSSTFGALTADAADAASMKACEENKPTGLSPCMVYRITPAQ